MPVAYEGVRPEPLSDFLRKAVPQEGAALPPLREWLDLAEAWRIAIALRDCRGNRSAAARALGIGRRTLYTKLEKLGLSERTAEPIREATRP